MTTLAWIMIILTVLILAISLFLWHKTKDDADIGLNLFLSMMLLATFGLFISESVEKETTHFIQSQYHPKTKVTITSDSTYHIDTLYYIKIK